MEANDLDRVRLAAIDCLYDQLEAILNIPAVELDGKVWVMFKADIVPEAKRRALEYYKTAKGCPP